MTLPRSFSLERASCAIDFNEGGSTSPFFSSAAAISAAAADELFEACCWLGCCCLLPPSCSCNSAADPAKCESVDGVGAFGIDPDLEAEGVPALAATSAAVVADPADAEEGKCPFRCWAATAAKLGRGGLEVVVELFVASPMI